MSCYEIFGMIFCFLTGGPNDLNPECFIRINDLPGRQPLVLYPELGKGFIYPKEVGEDSIVIAAGTSIRLACPGGHILFNTTKYYENEYFQCINNSSFLFVDKNIEDSIYKIFCDGYPRHMIRKTSQSCGNGRTGEIGFSINNHVDEFLKIIDFCHNELWSYTVYAHTTIQTVINAAQRNVSRQGFVKGEFFPGISVNKVYRRSNQQKTFEKILGSKTLAYKYIKNTGNYYLARGHLIAKRDLIYAAQQRATFYYVNVVPMWQNINNGNWKRLERNIRNYASKNNCNLDVWAGGLDILQLKDTSGDLRDIFLYYLDYNKQAIPVPKLLFKVAYDSQSQAGVVFVTANNPYLTELPENYIICKDVCKQMDYIKWDPRFSHGYSYCCHIDDFRNIFHYLPHFKTKKLLN